LQLEPFVLYMGQKCSKVRPAILRLQIGSTGVNWGAFVGKIRRKFRGCKCTSSSKPKKTGGVGQTPLEGKDEQKRWGAKHVQKTIAPT